MHLSAAVKYFVLDGLMNTGLGIEGAQDPYWKIISIPSGTTGFTAGSNAIIKIPISTWPKAYSKLIGLDANANTFFPPGTYIYQLSFASASYISSSVAVYFMADDAVTSVTVSDGTVNIKTITTFSGVNGYMGSCFARFILSDFGPTTTILKFSVLNQFTYSNPTSLLVQFGEFSVIPGCSDPVPCKYKQYHRNNTLLVIYYCVLLPILS